MLCPSSASSLSVVTHCSAHVKRIISTSFKGLEHLRAFHAVKHFPAEGKKWKKSKEQFVCSHNCPPLHYSLAVNRGCLFSKPGKFPRLLLPTHSHSVVTFSSLLYVLRRHVTHALLSPTITPNLYNINLSGWHTKMHKCLAFPDQCVVLPG